MVVDAANNYGPCNNNGRCPAPPRCIRDLYQIITVLNLLHMKSYNVFPIAAISFLLLILIQPLQAQDAGGWQLLDTDDHPTERHENAAAVVDGKLYLVGGRGERPVEVYDPATQSWEERATPPLSMHHFQAVSHDGKIYVIGALNGGYPDEDPIGHVYIYDPQADRWTIDINIDRKSTRLNSSHVAISYAVFCLKKKK